MDELQPRRGPGRPPKSETEAGELPPRRSNRKPFGTMQQKLAREPRTGFHQHWFNDVPGRVNLALDAGYEHVKDKDGKNVCAVVGVAEMGGPLHAYLMEIPEEWWQEDMRRQELENEERMAPIKDARAAAKDADPRDRDKFYIGKENAPAKRG